MRGNKKNQRIKQRIASRMEVIVNKPRTVKSYSKRGVTVEQGYFNLVNQISTNQALQPSNEAYKTVGLLGLKKTFKRSV